MLQIFCNCPLTANGAPLIDPIAEYDHTIGQSITGGYVYRGSAIASLRGRYVFGDLFGRLMYLAPDASGGYDLRDLIGSTGLSIVSFAEDSNGELYITDYGGGGIYQIVPGSGTINDTIPANLLDTGCVSMADPKQPAIGLIPYAPNAPFWSDGADKQRWMALPDTGKITIGADGDWSFPNGTVLVKNFKLGSQLIETRLFMRHMDTGNWGGYTYQWNAAQTVATLIKGGLVTHLPAPPSQDWIYPSEAQCLQCHTNAAGRSLGLETAQLNSDITYPDDGARRESARHVERDWHVHDSTCTAAECIARVSGSVRIQRDTCRSGLAHTCTRIARSAIDLRVARHPTWICVSARRSVRLTRATLLRTVVTSASQGHA